VFERFDQADRPVAAHPEITDVVEKNDTPRGIIVVRLTQQCAHNRVVPAGFADDRAAKMIVLAPKRLQFLGHRSAAKIGKALYNNTRGLAAGVRIYRANFHRVRHLPVEI
jgi:hypothetical protein